MKTFFKKIFNRSASKATGEVQEKDQVEKTPLETLSYAISDVGLFTWYTADLPKYAQLEFTRTMLFFETNDKSKAPSNQVALQFQNVNSIHIFQEDEPELPEDWLDLLANDELRSLDVNYDYFSFDLTEIKQIISECKNQKKIYGANLDEALKVEGINLAFTADEISFVICAEKMLIKTHDGDVDIKSIPNIHGEWWKYWGEYWSKKDSENKMPYDQLCEITIPAGSYK